MKRLSTLAAVVVAAISLGMAAVASAQESPTPEPTNTPTNTPQATATSAATATPQATSSAVECTGTELAGGGTITVGQNEITLPGGAEFTITVMSGGAFEVCFVDAGTSVTISANCTEIDRDNPDDDPGADFVLDLIVDSCERAPGTPTPSAQGSSESDIRVLTPTVTSQVQGSQIAPPSTGDGGLK